MFSFHQIALLLSIWSANGLIMPITKSDGSLDISSLMSHLALVETSIEDKASAAEMAQVQSDLAASHKELSDTKTEVTRLKTELETTITELRTAQADLKKAGIDIAVVKIQQATGSSLDQHQHQSSEINTVVGGATFTRWGRTSCPADSMVVYKGYTGGSNIYIKGAGAATILCLPEHPIYSNYTTTEHASSGFGSTIYGTEYDARYPDMYFDKMYNEDMPCVVCESTNKGKAIMVPARDVCFQGWTLEYSGYLMGPGVDWKAGEYICVDSDPEATPGGEANDNGQVLYSVEGKCGSLPCPPYHDDWELTCCVCSK